MNRFRSELAVFSAYERLWRGLTSDRHDLANTESINRDDNARNGLW